MGSSTDEDGRVGFGVSYDWGGSGEEAAREWKRRVEGLLEEGEGKRKMGAKF